MGRDLSMCHPRLQVLAQQLKERCGQQGLPIQIGECFRSVKEQDALYAQGRTAPGSIVTNARGSSYSSMHQWGVAFDFYRDDGKGAFNEEDAFFKKVGAVGKSIGLEWGGDWKSIVDKPHFQLPDWGSTPAKLKAAYQTYDNFRKTWNTSGAGVQAGNSSPQTGAKVTAYCCGNGVRIRSKAGTDREIYGVLNHGNLFDVLGYAGDWVKVNAANTIGYMYQDYVAYWVGACLGNNVRVRKGPSANTAILGVLNRGNLFDVLEPGEQWVRINAAGVRGYLYGQYVARS